MRRVSGLIASICLVFLAYACTTKSSNESSELQSSELEVKDLDDLPPEYKQCTTPSTRKVVIYDENKSKLEELPESSAIITGNQQVPEEKTDLMEILGFQRTGIDFAPPRIESNPSPELTNIPVGPPGDSSETEENREATSIELPKPKTIFVNGKKVPIYITVQDWKDSLKCVEPYSSENEQGQGQTQGQGQGTQTTY